MRSWSSAGRLTIPTPMASSCEKVVVAVARGDNSEGMGSGDTVRNSTQRYLYTRLSHELRFVPAPLMLLLSSWTGKQCHHILRLRTRTHRQSFRFIVCDVRLLCSLSFVSKESVSPIVRSTWLINTDIARASVDSRRPRGLCLRRLGRGSDIDHRGWYALTNKLANGQCARHKFTGQSPHRLTCPHGKRFGDIGITINFEYSALLGNTDRRSESLVQGTKLIVRARGC